MLRTAHIESCQSQRRHSSRRTCYLLLWKVWLYSLLLAVRIGQNGLVDSTSLAATTSAANITGKTTTTTTITTKTTTAAFTKTSTKSPISILKPASTTSSNTPTTSAPTFIDRHHSHRHNIINAKEFSTLDTEVVERLIKEWAPVVWLAPEEKFMPLGVEEFLNHVHPADKSESIIDSIPVGDNSKKTYLVTNADIEELLENENSFLYGRNPSESPVPIYAVVNLCDKPPQRTHHHFPTTSKPTPLSITQTHFEKQYPMQSVKHQLHMSTRAPYIPVSLDPSEVRNITIRRSSRFYPVFKRVIAKRDVSAHLPVTNRLTEKADHIRSPYEAIHFVENVQKVNIQPQVPASLSSTSQLSTSAAINTADLSMSSHTPSSADATSLHHHVNNFIANLADNVRFTGASDEIDNGINLDSDSLSFHQQKYKIKKKLPSFHVTYWMFYPYSQGKTMCTLSLGPFGSIPFPTVYDFCIGKRKDIGSHIGDWEHMSLSFNGAAQPEAMYVSAHDAGAYYTYNYLTGSFEFKKQETRKGILQRPNFPKTVTTFNNHPVLFAAKGSHGLWTAPGKHRFVKVARLYDINGFGTPWNTWKSVDITYENLKSYGRSFIPSWLTFKGKWGNPKSKCHPFRRIGLNFCEYSDGPTGIPLKEPHFQCDANLNF